MAAPKSKIPLALGLTAAGGVGYYLYTAGGSPKVAEKQFEKDISAASAKIKSEIPGRSTEAKKEGEKLASQVGANYDSAAERARAELAKAEAYGRDAKNDTLKKIDAADRKIEAKASEAKSGISSWFGGK
ncbi:hypothetical protein BJ878DRAFT_521477 [Calycina marina]|uniref:Calcofluor white hypersensitive protein n=1 Tax=Calycina marina TaxID=1763456 RepID=A0A9P8CBV1_9HELO|nr:hypothetical protein BJ878DRAFT_521477 [Calycina marina]